MEMRKTWERFESISLRTQADVAKRKLVEYISMNHTEIAAQFFDSLGRICSEQNVKHRLSLRYSMCFSHLIVGDCALFLVESIDGKGNVIVSDNYDPRWLVDCWRALRECLRREVKMYVNPALIVRIERMMLGIAKDMRTILVDFCRQELRTAFQENTLPWPEDYNVKISMGVYGQTQPVLFQNME